MADPGLKITRRGFLKTSIVGVAALALSDKVLRPLVEGLVRMGLPVPWYRRGPIVTTYNYCDMCPWRCGVVVQT
ncbi:MAG TPA: twin-arginine translocation signal domain-containing protein, partial [Roseiflexaceae bacterium]|nr:twin-arginine translocation signal domain-containing protein [Roseiflexaceae bacterium]